MTLRLVDSDLELTLTECRRRWAGLGAALLLIEKQPTFEGIRKAEYLAGSLGDAFGRLALLIEEREKND